VDQGVFSVAGAVACSEHSRDNIYKQLQTST